MIRYENQCCDCATESYHCIGRGCKFLNVKIYICDCCKNEFDYGELFYFEDRQLCINCIKNNLEKVE